MKFRGILLFIYGDKSKFRYVIGRVDKLLSRKRIPRNNILKFSQYIFRPTLIKSEMKNYNSIQILKIRNKQVLQFFRYLDQGDQQLQFAKLCRDNFYIISDHCIRFEFLVRSLPQRLACLFISHNHCIILYDRQTGKHTDRVT